MFKKIFIYFLLLSFFQYSFAIEINVNEEELETKSARVIDPKNTLYIELKDGVVIAELFPQIAPRHVQRIRSLVKDNFYDGLKFHRVIAGFMAQTGDPTGTGRGGSSYGRLQAEFNDEHHTRGTLSMARASNPDSANSQFFIVTGDFFPELDKQYTIFGRVIEGMEYVDKIKSGDTALNGIVENPDIIVKMLTGDMLNNKSLDTIKKEMKVVENVQNEALKQNPSYEKKSILKLLYASKDINSEEDDVVATEIENKNDTKTENNTEKNIDSSTKNSIVDTSN